MVHVYKLFGKWRQKQVDLKVQGQPSLQSEFQGYKEKPCLEKQKTKQIEN